MGPAAVLSVRCKKNVMRVFADCSNSKMYFINLGVDGRVCFYTLQTLSGVYKHLSIYTST